MPDLQLLASVEYGGYISPVKLGIFVVLFFCWIWILGWVNRDTQAVGTKTDFWTAVILVSGAVAAIIWMVVPVFIVGLLLYLIAVGATSMGYVAHRNAKVADHDKVLTAEHIKNLFSSDKKKLDSIKGFLFITANNNEVPIPDANTPDYFGYKTACDFFTDAIWRRADTIILLPAAESYSVTYSVDGAALKQPAIDKQQTEYLFHFIKNLADLDTREKRKPQKGTFSIRQDNEVTDWQLSTAGSTAGEQARIKHLTKAGIKRLSEIGLTPKQYELLSKIHDGQKGLFIISGPQKSGVTSTLYSLMRNHDAFLNSIETLERQPSAALPNITQHTFALSDSGATTYGKKLQTVIRMGPDIVGVADCLDAETAQVACTAAKNGKLIYVALKADSAAQAMGKWMKLVGDKRAAVEPLFGIINQRLLRKLCENCKQGYAPNKELLRKFNLPPDKAKVLYRPGKVQLDKHGKPRPCEDCQEIGFVDRMGVFELVIMNGELRDAVQQSNSISEISAHFRSAKMVGLQQQALREAVSGTIAINEIVRVFSTSKKPRPKRPEKK